MNTGGKFSLTVGESAGKQENSGASQVITVDRTVSVVKCDTGVTFVYGEGLSTLDRINAIVDLLDVLRAEASVLCGTMMSEMAGDTALALIAA